MKNTYTVQVIGKAFDLSLQKFITKVNGTAVSQSRAPLVDVTNLKNGTSTDAKYTTVKTPVSVEVGDIVEYTIRVYNEGEVAGYAEEVEDDIPEGLVFLPDNEINQKYGWNLYDENGKETDNVYCYEMEINGKHGIIVYPNDIDE